MIDRRTASPAWAVGDHTARAVRQVARLIAEADALLVTAGAGMSADSGLPVFRGNEGFWAAYPPLRHLGISFERMAQPGWFNEGPRMAWAFYGHRRALYRSTMPHAGHQMLRRWGEPMPAGAFVLTTNVDGQFETSGFAAGAIAEQHGSIHRLQCSVSCSDALWDAPELALNIDLAILEARAELPRCPHCGAVARPNVLMFNDGGWLSNATRAQMRRFDAWLAGVRGRQLVVLEIGAGTALPTLLAAALPKRFVDRPSPPRAQPLQRRIAVKSATITCIDLSVGYAWPVDPDWLQDDEISAVLAPWYQSGSRRYVPLPACRGFSATGYLMAGTIVATSAKRVKEIPGAALLRIRAPDGADILSVGFGRRTHEGAWLWRKLHEEARVALQPLEYPSEPWIVRRREPAAVRHAAMLPALSAIELGIGTAWLRHQARQDGMK